MLLHSGVLPAALERRSYQPRRSRCLRAKSKVVVDVTLRALLHQFWLGSRRAPWCDGGPLFESTSTNEYRGIPTTFIMHRNVDEEAQMSGPRIFTSKGRVILAPTGRVADGRTHLVNFSDTNVASSSTFGGGSLST